jgi:hypothetical protein
MVKSLEFSEEDMERFRLNGEKLMAETREKRKHSPMTHEEFLEFLKHGPVADEETIKMQDEVRREMSQWKAKW